MKNLKKLQAGAFLVTLAASAVLPTSDAFAHPKHRTYNGHDYGAARWEQNYRQDDRDNYRERYDRNDRYRSYEVRRLPEGCRRVVVRNRTYYTRDNVYYTYNPTRRAYVTVNLFNLGLSF
jgi:hypothetical protein